MRETQKPSEARRASQARPLCVLRIAALSGDHPVLAKSSFPFPPKIECWGHGCNVSPRQHHSPASPLLVGSNGRTTETPLSGRCFQCPRLRVPWTGEPEGSFLLSL